MTHDSFDLDAFDAIPDPLAAPRGESGTQRVLAESGAGAAAAAPKGSWEAVAASLGPAKTRREIRREHVIALVFAAAWLGCVALVAGVRPHYELLTLVVQGAVPLALSFLVLALALSKGRLGFGTRPTTLVAALAIAPVLFGAVVLAVPIPLTEEDLRSGVDCGFVELFSGVVPGLALVWAHRRGAANGAGLRMAALGLAVGLFAAGMWAFHCPDSGAAHVLLSHGLPALGIAGAAGALAIKLGRIR